MWNKAINIMRKWTKPIRNKHGNLICKVGLTEDGTHVVEIKERGLKTIIMLPPGQEPTVIWL